MPRPLLLVVVCFAAGAIPLVHADDTRAIEAALAARMNEAEQLAAAGRHAEALDAYLWVFDHSRGVDGWAQVRRANLVPFALAQLGREHAPALDALRTRMRQVGQTIADGVDSPQEMLTFVALARVLGDNQAVLTLYDQLKAADPPRDRALAEYRRLIWHALVEAERYTELTREVDRVAHDVIERIGQFKAALDFPAARRGFDYGTAKTAIEKDGQSAYRVLCALKRDRAAAKLRDRLLEFETSIWMYMRLITAADAAGRQDLLAGLIEDARAKLPEHESRILITHTPPPAPAEDAPGERP